MPIGNSKVGQFSAVVSHEATSAEIELEYDSKNKNFTETLGLSEAVTNTLNKILAEAIILSEVVSKTITVNVASAITVDDFDYTSWQGGMFNDAMINARMMGTGNEQVRIDDITINIV